MSRCSRIHRLLPLSAGGELDAAERARVDTHLAECPRCRAEAADFLRLRDMARRVERADARGLPDNPMTDGEISTWTAGIAHDGSPDP